VISEQAGSKRLQVRQLLVRTALAMGAMLVGVVLGLALTSNSWKIVITAVGWTALMGAILLDPLLGLLLWVVVSPYAPFVHLNFSLGAGIPDLGLDRVAAGLFCMVMLAQVARRRRRLAPLTALDGAILLFAMALVMSARAATGGTFTALQNILDAWLVPLLIYYLAKNLVRDQRGMRRVIAALALIGSYLVLLTVYEHLTGNEVFVVFGRFSSYGENLKRINSLLQNPAYMALALNMVLPFAVRASLTARDRTGRWGYALAALAVLGTVVSLYNRAGWLSGLLVLLVSAAYHRPLRKWLLLAVVIIVPVAALSWGMVSDSALFSDRLTYGLSVDYRVRAMEAALQLVASQPLFGVGFGSFSTLSLTQGLLTKVTANYWVPTTHNSYLDVLASAGLSGMVPYVAIFLIIAWQSWRLYRRQSQEPAVDRGLIVALWCVFLVFAVTIATVDVVAAPFCSMVFWLIVGSVMGSQSWPTRWGRRAAASEGAA